MAGAAPSVQFTRRPWSLWGHAHEEGGEAQFRRAYAQCLWLGEAHTPLSTFVACLHTLEQGTRTLLTYVRTPAHVRARFPIWARAVLKGMDAPDAAPSAATWEEERLAMHAALRYGPVAPRYATDTEALGPFVQAVHCREYVGCADPESSSSLCWSRSSLCAHAKTIRSYVQTPA